MKILHVCYQNHEFAAILDLTHNAIAKVLSNHTTMSSIPENPMVDTIYIHSVENHVNLKLNLAEMETILDFTHNAMSEIFLATPLCRVYLKNPW